MSAILESARNKKRKTGVARLDSLQHGYHQVTIYSTFKNLLTAYLSLFETIPEYSFGGSLFSGFHTVLISLNEIKYSGNQISTYLNPIILARYCNSSR